MFLILRLIRQQAKRHPVESAVTMALILTVAVLWIAEPLYSSYAIDALLVAKTGGSPDYVRIFGYWALLFIAISIVQALEKYFTWDLDNLMVLERREDIYEHVLDLDIAFHTKQKAGEVVKILDEGSDTLMELQRNLFLELLPSSIASVVFLIIGFMLQPVLGMILVVSLTLYVAVVVIGIKKTVVHQNRVNKLWIEAIGRAYDSVLNVFSVKSGSQENAEMNLMRTSHRKSIASQRKVNYRWALIEAVNFFMLTRILLIAIGILLYVRGSITLGQLYFFQFSFFRVLTPFEMLSGILPQWNKRIGKVRLSEQMLRSLVRVASKPDAKILPDLHGELKLERVCFSYRASSNQPVITDDDTVTPAPPVPTRYPEDESDVSAACVRDEHAAPPADAPPERDHSDEVLHDIDLRIHAGEHIAFVGHSGAGKTTLAMLLNRFYDVTEGRILVDGTDMRDLDMHWWRAQIGLVFQDNIMFNDSVQNNIRYARPDATDEEVAEAARRAAAHGFIEKMPEGYKTLIGDRGIRLSGGQRQRVAIARAILKRPKIVVLDEATSALDSVTEREVQQGIKGLIEGRTSCIIAHRLSTVRSVDRIAVFDQGKLIACAPHEALMKTCPIYREMVELQSHGMLAET